MITFFKTWKIRRAIKKADNLHKPTKRQYYVLKWSGKIQVISRLQIKNLKKKGKLSRELTWLKLQEIAIYKTA